jgi:hypothetical protein
VWRGALCNRQKDRFLLPSRNRSFEQSDSLFSFFGRERQKTTIIKTCEWEIKRFGVLQKNKNFVVFLTLYHRLLYNFSIPVCRNAQFRKNVAKKLVVMQQRT